MCDLCKNRKITLSARLLFAAVPLLLFLFISTQSVAQPDSLLVGAEQPEKYLDQLKGKRIAIMVNPTSMVGKKHLVDYLVSERIKIEKIFSVEHGFRGDMPDGEQIANSVDAKTGIPIVSLYGEKKKPSKADMADVDLVVFDIQDVGCRFYTYISSLHYLMEACAENKTKLIILDRPNPNGDYVDGPVLQKGFESFVGMHPIPVVHGCTVGELARMINGEGWLSGKTSCNLEVVAVKNYTHSTKYVPPIKPSPNLPNYLSIRLYPSLCFFEATNVSIGRGTDFPFQVIGFPGNKKGSFAFTPQSIKGMSTKPLFEGEVCRGVDLRNLPNAPKFTLSYLIEFQKLFSNPILFWKSERWMNLLSGSNQLYKQLNQGQTEEQIRATWQSAIKNYKTIRKKYLLYPDFE